MAYAEIEVCSGLAPSDIVFERTIFVGAEAVADGYSYVKRVADGRADWLIRASAYRDFEDNLLATIILRIGPKPYWADGPLTE